MTLFWNMLISVQHPNSNESLDSQTNSCLAIFLEYFSLERNVAASFTKLICIYSVTYHQIMFSKIYINF